MTKKIAKKAMGIARGTALTLGVAVMLALLLGVATTALAGTGVGARFQLGQTNTVNAVTMLVGSVAGPSLQVDNNSTHANATALDLQVEPGKAPMKVNSDTRVANFNADKLDGVSHEKLRTIPLMVEGAHIDANVNGANPVASSAGIRYSPDTTSVGAHMSFVLPPDYDLGAPILLDLIFSENSVNACSVYLQSHAMAGPGPDGHTVSGSFVPTGASGPISLPAGERTVHKATLTLSDTSNHAPGMYQSFDIVRQGALASDTCGSVTLTGAQVRY
jgi:hypothetical protein